ncbi:MAG: NPCBM/NEW2 domain-containing protein [Chthoniobacteraceae bacterium]
MKPRILFPLLSLCMAMTANAGSVRLLSGETYEGKLQFVNNQIVVNASKNSTTPVDLSNVLDAVFQPIHGEKGNALPRGAMLINGTVLAGTIGIPDASAPVKLGDITVPATSIAWLIYGQMPRTKIPTVSSGQTGVILPDGQFFPGTIGDIVDKKVAINSAIFGPQRFLIAGGDRAQINALVLRDVQPNIGHYEVIAKDGSTYLVDAIRTDVDGILIHDSIAGDVKIKNDNLSEIRLSSRQYQYLTGLKPAQVDVPKGGDATAAFKVETVDDIDNMESLLTAPNAAISYQIPQGFTTFSCTIFIPKDAVTGARYTFSIYGDGRLLSRSVPIAAGDNPQHISVALANTRMMALRLEPMAPNGAAWGKWAQPMFMRP